jgi:hypothetical protein
MQDRPQALNCLFLLSTIILLLLSACRPFESSSDERQSKQQEVLLNEATSQVGMPSIKNFRERKILKDILELRDQEGLITYSYLWNEFNGRLIFLGETIGYGLPCATQFTNPQKIAASYAQGGFAILQQADPNGLFSPSSAEGTWLLMRDPKSGEAKPVYVEPRVIVSPFKLPSQ